jgi:hypothetical protein
MVVAPASLRASALVLVGLIGGFYVVTWLKMTPRSLRGWSLPRSSGRGGVPAKDLSHVSVAAIQDGLFGETGQPLVRPFGMTNFNYNYDSQEYTPFNKWIWHGGVG